MTLSLSLDSSLFISHLTGDEPADAVLAALTALANALFPSWRHPLLPSSLCTQLSLWRLGRDGASAWLASPS